MDDLEQYKAKLSEIESEFLDYAPDDEELVRDFEKHFEKHECEPQFNYDEGVIVQKHLHIMRGELGIPKQEFVEILTHLTEKILYG